MATAWEREELAAIGRRIARHRHLKGLSQKELAEAVKRLGQPMSERSVQNYEAGRQAAFPHLEVFATVLGVEKQAFLEPESNEVVFSHVEANQVVRELERMSEELSTLRALITGLTAMVERLEPPVAEHGEDTGNPGSPSQRGPIRSA